MAGVPSRIVGDQQFLGQVTFSLKPILASGQGWADGDVADSADIAESKCEQQHARPYNQAGSAVSETRVVHHVWGLTGEVLGLDAGSVAAAVGAATVTLDLKKNGVSVLGSVITLDSANTAYVAEAGSLSGTPAVLALAQGDVLSIVTVATAGGGTLPTGVFASVRVREKAR